MGGFNEQERQKSDDSLVLFGGASLFNGRVEITDWQFDTIQREMLDALRAQGIEVQVVSGSDFERRNKKTFSVFEIQDVICAYADLNPGSLLLLSETRTPDGTPLVLVFKKRNFPLEGYTYIIAGNHGKDEKGSPQSSSETTIDKVDFDEKGDVEYALPFAKYNVTSKQWEKL